MFDTKCQCIHGWVEDLVKDHATVDGYRLSLRLSNDEVINISVGPVTFPLKLGDEVSVGIDRLLRDRVVALSNHSTGESVNFIERKISSDSFEKKFKMRVVAYCGLGILFGLIYTWYATRQGESDLLSIIFNRAIIDSVAVSLAVLEIGFYVLRMKTADWVDRHMDNNYNLWRGAQGR